jgi:Uncharacterized protein conserved in bacteria (DUF2330)
MGNRRWLCAVLTLSLAAVAYGERDAVACGGCIPPPPPPNQSVDSVITGERMIFSISKDQTTLYDEITYSGKPSSFAWVLPIKGEVEVGLSADILFATIDQLTASIVTAPPENCPPPPTSCGSYSGGGGGCTFGGASAGADFGAGFASEDAGAAGGDGGVTVLTQGQVGPYEMVQLKSNDGSALTNWLDKNGYRIAAADGPVIAHYVSEGMDFLALKLIPGEGVSAMQPVRVTTQGASPVLPLRMVGVGTGATTGITLWVVADGRWEPQNFPFFTIESSELSWNWTTDSSNFEALRISKENASNGRAWLVESSLELSQYSVANALATAISLNFSGVGGYSNPTPISPPKDKDAGKEGSDAGSKNDASATDAGDPDDASRALDGEARDVETTDAESELDGGAPEATTTHTDAGSPPADAEAADAFALTPTEQQLGTEDLAVLFAGLSVPNARITRLRSDVAHSALSSDLVIQASSDQGELSNTYTTSQQIGQPQCPIFDSSCFQSGTLPRDQADAYAAANYPGYGNSGGGCAGCRTTSGPLGARATIGILLGLAVLGAARSRKRTQRRAR